MSKIAEHIDSQNKKGRKALTIFLTAGYPTKNSFLDYAKVVVDAGADILEIGVPFGDSLADGPVIQSSYYKALEENISTKDVLKFVEAIKSERDIPIVIMGSSNPINNYGTTKFLIDVENSGADGVIVPDVTLEEYDSFFTGTSNSIDKILLTTPTSSEARIKSIDEKSSGFVYCVSVVGTTGVRGKFDDTVMQNLERTYSIVKNNKLQIGFGISNGEDVESLKDYCDGVIVGSAVIKLLNKENGIKLTSDLISELSSACLIE